MRDEPEAETRAAQSPAPARRAGPSGPSGSMVGRTILHYRILEKLGQGGMGVVYKAEDEKLARTVALKFLPPDALESTDERARLMREARAAASLDHPGICTVHDVEESDGQIFISMAHVEGESLKETIDSGATAMELDQALDLVSQVADALENAHSKGVVHRDVKPANIMVSPGGRTKVMDFGLAKLSGGTKLTQTGAMMGTVAYMSPEQARGVEADQRTDIWSLGVVLYELVSGELPFRGEYSAALLYSILNEDPAPVTSLRPGLPVELDRVLAKALAKDPGERYQTAGEFREELERLRVGSPVSAPAVRRRKAGQRLLAALGTLVIVLAVVIGLDIGGLRGRLTGGGGPGRIASLAVLPVANLSGDPEQEYFADGMTDALIANLASIGGFERVIARQSVMRFKGTNEPLREIAQKLDVEALVEASVLRAGGEVQVTARLVEARTDRHLWSETYKRDVGDVLTLLNEVTASIAQGIDVVLSPTEEARLAEARPVDPELYQLYLQGRFHLSRRDIESAIQLFDKVIAMDPGYGPAYAGLSDAYHWSMLGYGPAQTDARARAEEAATKALELDDGLAEAHISRGRLSMQACEWVEAESSFKKAVALKPNHADAHRFYGWVLMLTARFDEAIAEAHRALELDPLSLSLNQEVAWPYYFAERYEEYMRLMLNALEMDPNAALTHYNLGDGYLMLGSYEEAIREYNRATELIGKGSHSYRGSIGLAYALAGRRAEALEILAEVEAEPIPAGPWPVPAIYVALGENEKALDALERLHEERGCLMVLKVAPDLKPLHSEPRFIALLDAMGLNDSRH